MDSAPETPPPRREGTLGGKILWAVVAAAVIAPPTWLVGIVCLMFAADHFGARNRWLHHLGIQILIAGIVALALAAAWIRGGLRRDYPSDAGLLWRWSIAAAGVLALTVCVVVWFQNDTRSYQDKYVVGTARQISAAADQYFLENSVSVAAFDQLVGSSNYLKAINTVADETFPAFYTQGVTITVSGVAGARTVTYAP
jgi:type IV pilus assembly protein PilA